MPDELPMQARTTLFRQEALDFNREKLLGDALAAHPLSLRFLTAAASALAMCIIAFACWGQYTPKVHVRGYLAPNGGLIRIYAIQTGTLIEQHVSEGQHVRLGDTLFVLSTEEGSLQTPLAQAAAIDTIRQRLESLQRDVVRERRIDEMQVQGIRERMRDAEAEGGVLRAEIATQEQRVASAERITRRYEDLLPQHYVSEAQAQQKRDELLEQQTRLQELQRSRAGLQRDIDGLSLDLATGALKSTNEREAAERDAAAMQQQLTEYQARRTILITAPSDGVATAILGARGQRTTAQMLLLSILPAGAHLEAHLLVPSRAIGFVALGQRVALRLQPFPYQQFGTPKGRVTEISRTVVAPNDEVSPLATSEAAYRVVVALDSEFLHTRNRSFPLQPGMLLDADISLQRERIIEWAFAPLASALGTPRT
jgi:membrane fusion protein